MENLWKPLEFCIIFGFNRDGSLFKAFAQRGGAVWRGELNRKGLNKAFTVVGNCCGFNVGYVVFHFSEVFNKRLCCNHRVSLKGNSGLLQARS